MSPASGGRPRDEYWPWDTGHGAANTSSTSLPPVVDEIVPGRSSFRVAAVLSAVLLLAVAVVVAVNLGRGSGALGGDPDPTTSSTRSSQGADARTAGGPLTGVSATAFDPEGTDGAENDDEASNAVDDDLSTVWTTQGYEDQIGPPPGLKTGVGLLLDLGKARPVSGIDLTFVGAPTGVSLFITDVAPNSVDGLTPVAEYTGQGTSTTLDLAAPASGRYLVVWLTSLPTDGSVFRGTVADVVIRGATDG